MALKLNPVTGQLDVVLDKASEIKQTGSTSGIGAATVQDALDALGAPTAKNYIRYSDAEIGTTTGWSLGNVTLTSNFPSGVPTFGSGASANLSFTNTTVTPLAGTRSFLLSSSAATTAGNFLASDAFTIDSADLAKVLTISFVYQLTSGTANFSGTSSNSFGIAIYDVTASAWIYPAGAWAITQTTGVGRAVATFQTPITSNQYRLVLFNANATSGAVTLKLDRISVGPVSVPVGAPVTDWVDAGPITISATGTPPTKGTTTIDKVRWRRVGDSAIIKYEFAQTTGGSAGSGTYLLKMPTGLKIDTTKLTASTQFLDDINATVSKAPMSSGMIRNTSGGAGEAFLKVYDQDTFTVFGTDWFVTANDWGSAYYQLSNATTSLTVSCMVPIQGWSSQVQMSSDTDTRVIAARYGSTSTTGAGSASEFQITYDTRVFDTSGSMSGATYTVPVTGYYRLSGMLTFVSGFTGAYGYLSAYVNGVFRSYIIRNTAYGTPASFMGSTIVQLNAGDAITFYGRQNQTSAVVNLDGSATNNWVTIERLSGPAVVAASETVAASYGMSAAVSGVANNGIVKYDTKVKDTHSMYNVSTGVLTIPVSGTYVIAAVCGVSAGGTVGLYVQKNGATGLGQLLYLPAANQPFSGSIEVSLLAGETVSILVSNSSATTFTGINATYGYTNSFYIARIGF